MKELIHRHRRATDKMSKWLAAANNARAMGDTAVQTDGAHLVLIIEVCFRRLSSPTHHYDCYCVHCVEAWEETANEVEAHAKAYGVNLKQHSFGALRRVADGRS